MASKSRISIVTISLNQDKYLTEAIESVACSDPSRLQYVIVDAGSTDTSRDIIQAQSHRFHRTILEPDRGPVDGLNKGFAACDGDIFGYLNSDDRFCEGALDFVLDYFERHPEIDVLCGAISIIDAHGRPARRKRLPDIVNPRKYGYACFFWQQATFFRRSAYVKVGGFDDHSLASWDSELILDMVVKGFRVGYTATLLGQWRIYGESLTGSGKLHARSKLDLRRVHHTKLVQAGVLPFSPLRKFLIRALYRFNIRRHLSYFFGAKAIA